MAENYLNATKPVRSYEISIWTLQDRFLSVLKWSDQNHKGQIQDPEMVLRDDGTEELSFTIPKYYYDGATKIENPLWLHLDNQPLEANMHKLKVIFNKGTSDEGIFEFLVTSVAHDHNVDELDLTVKAEGLAFHELGKIGYRISLSKETYITEINEYDNKKLTTEDFKEQEPVQNIQYWNDLIFKDSEGHWKGNWRYRIEMDWSAYNNANEERKENIVYEDEYTSSWQLDESKNELVPRTIEGMREKQRPVEISESNLYNVTQTIAEQFGVYCRYEYAHDEDYSIKAITEDGTPGRTVVYYNNYYQDKQGHIDLTYPYSSSAITRTVDNSEIISKMYVQTVEEGDNEVSIMDVDANKSKEDYLLNFDYLHEIQAITDEQYAEIPKYEEQMHNLNDEIIMLKEHIDVIKNQLVDVNARITTLTNSITEAINQSDEAAKEASGITGKPVLTDINTSLTVIDSSEDNANWGSYVNVQRWPGLSKESIELFENNNYSGKATQYSGPITTFSVQYDDDGLTIVRLTNISRDIDEATDHQIYMRAKYDPYSYYNELAERWKNRAIQDKAALTEAETERDTLNYYLYGSKGSNAEYLGAGMADNDSSTIESSDYISTEIDEMRVLSESQATAWQSNEDWQNSDPFANINLARTSSGGLEGELKTALKKKAALFNKFEKMMGPAMREGYWQPDDFNDYGHRYNDSFAINILGSPNGSSSPTTEYLQFLWDDKKYYENESPIIYNVGINNSINEHLAINISTLLSDEKKAKFLSHLDNIVFRYIDPNVLITIQELNKKKNNSSFDSENLFPLLIGGENGIQSFDNLAEGLEYYDNYQNLNTTLNAIANKTQWQDLKPSNPDIFNVLEERITTINRTLTDMDWLIGQERGFKEEGYTDRIAQLQKNIEILKKMIPIINDDYLTPAARVQSWIPAQIEQLEKNQWRVYRLGGGCEFGWISTNGGSPVFSLIITGAEQLPDQVINFLRWGKYKKESLSVVNEKYEYEEIDLLGYDAQIGYYKEDEDEEDEDEEDEDEDETSDNFIPLLPVGANSDNYIAGTRLNKEQSAGITWENYSKKRVYPRLYFKTIKLKDYSSTLKISAKKTMLKNNEDYYIVPDDRAKGMEDSQAGYYLTFKPVALLNNQQDKLVPFELVYVLSNADTAIYLDAIKVMKENSRPKVEYNVELSLLNSTFIHTAYKRLNQIVHINDNDLHLEDVAGYISAVTLKLDRFWEDQVEIKNYETKFEDLFSTIVAQSEAMKKSAGGIKSAIQAFTSTGLIDGDLLQDSLFNNEDINFQFNNGKLTIDNVNGIWGRSTSRDGVEGVVAFRGGGIFTANKKDENGNWIWNTGIVPSGINASLITSGQLDTNRIKIYAGNEVRFQLNGNGLFAYKAFPSDSDLTSSAEYGEALLQGDTTKSQTGVDSLQYVKYDSEGLALIAKKGTWYKGLDNDGSSKYMQTIPDEIKRVEISWNGLILRNWSGKDVFYADPDTGNLTLEGSVVATSGYLGGWKLTENELSSKGIRLISAPNDKAGIELNPDMTYAKTAVNKDGNRLYAHYGLDGDGNMISGVIYYLTEEKNGNIGEDEAVYVEEVTPTSVRPKYVHVDTSYKANEQTNTTSESGGTNIDDHYTLTAEGSQTTENTGYTAYVMLANDHATYALYDADKKIAYTFSANELDAEWLKRLKTCTNLPTGKTADDYVIYTYTSSFVNLKDPNANTETETPIPEVVQPQGYKEITFQAKASDGQVIIKKGKIGAFDLNFEDGLSGGKIYDTKFDITNKLIGINDEKTEIEIPMGELFYDLIADSNAGTFTLKKVNGNIANFNIASMAAYRRAIEAAAAITLTVTVNGSGKVTAVATSGGGVTITKDDIQVGPNGGTVTVTASTQGASVSRTVIIQADGTPSLEKGSGGGGGGYCEVCQSTCFKTCATNCQGGCKKSCVRGCGTGCELDCTGSCLNACAESCAKSCTDSCTNGCQGACGSACSNNCVSLCGQTCASTCQTNCVHRNYPKS